MAYVIDWKFRKRILECDFSFTSYHITEDETGHKLTELLEIHFLELPKFFDDNIKKDEKVRMSYEAREAEIKDQVTRLQEAEEKGIAKGIKEGKEKGMIEVGIKLLEIRFISRVTELWKEQILKLEENWFFQPT